MGRSYKHSTGAYGSSSRTVVFHGRHFLIVKCGEHVHFFGVQSAVTNLLEKFVL